MLIFIVTGCHQIENSVNKHSLSKKTQSLSENESHESNIHVAISEAKGYRYPGFIHIPIRIRYETKNRCNYIVHDIQYYFSGIQKMVKSINKDTVRRSIRSLVIKPGEVLNLTVPMPIMIYGNRQMKIVGIEKCHDRTIIKNKKPVQIYTKRRIARHLLVPSSMISQYPRRVMTKSYSKDRNQMASKISLYQSEVRSKLQGEWKGLSPQEKRRKARQLKKTIMQIK